MNNRFSEEEKEVFKKLGEFVINPKLEKLEKKLNAFNFFEVLKITHDENRNSAILRWLLDPNETHGLQDYFLKKFLIQVLISNENNIKREIYPVEIDGIDFSGSFVQTEEVFSNKKRGDISIVHLEKEIYVLIENKINSNEGDQQTETYFTQAENIYKEYKRRLYVYLTPKGTPAENNSFLPLSYDDLVKVTMDVLEAKADIIPKNAQFFIEQFKQNIMHNISGKSEFEELVLELYKNHKTAIDKIFEVIPKNKEKYQMLGDATIKALNNGQHQDWTFHPTNTYCKIFRDEWRSNHNSKSKAPFFHYEFIDLNFDEDGYSINVDFHVELQNEEKRQRFIGLIKENSSDSPFNELEKGGKQRIHREPIRLNNKSDDINEFINHGSAPMIKFIKNTVQILNNASDKFR